MRKILGMIGVVILVAGCGGQKVEKSTTTMTQVSTTLLSTTPLSSETPVSTYTLDPRTSTVGAALTQLANKQQTINAIQQTQYAITTPTPSSTPSPFSFPLAQNDLSTVYYYSDHQTKALCVWSDSEGRVLIETPSTDLTNYHDAEIMNEQSIIYAKSSPYLEFWKLNLDGSQREYLGGEFEIFGEETVTSNIYNIYITWLPYYNSILYIECGFSCSNLKSFNVSSGKISSLLLPDSESDLMYSVSPNGKYILGITPQQILLLDPITGSSQQIFNYDLNIQDVNFYYKADIAWLPDSESFLTAIPHNAHSADAKLEIYQVFINNAPPRLLNTFNEGFLTLGWSPLISPNGEWITFETHAPNVEAPWPWSSIRLILAKIDGTLKYEFSSQNGEFILRNWLENSSGVIVEDREESTYKSTFETYLFQIDGNTQLASLTPTPEGVEPWMKDCTIE